MNFGAKNMKKQKVRFVVTNYPEGTEKIFICGNIEELGGWDVSKALELQYYQNEGTGECFIVDVSIPVGSSVAYKYLSNNNWESVECGIVAQEIPDRHITIKETKKRFVKDQIRKFRN